MRKVPWAQVDDWTSETYMKEKSVRRLNCENYVEAGNHVALKFLRIDKTKTTILHQFQCYKKIISLLIFLRFVTNCVEHNNSRKLQFTKHTALLRWKILLPTLSNSVEVVNFQLNDKWN